MELAAEASKKADQIKFIFDALLESKEAWIVRILIELGLFRTNIFSYNGYKLTLRFEKQYMEELKLKAAEDIKDDKVKQASEENEKAEGVEKSLKGQTSNASAEQDLDKFLLGDLEDSDGGADDGEESFDDDFDKIGNSDVEDEAQMKKAAAARG